MVSITKTMVYKYVQECDEVTAIQVARHFDCDVMMASGLLQRLKGDGKLAKRKGVRVADPSIWYLDPNYYVKKQGCGY